MTGLRLPMTSNNQKRHQLEQKQQEEEERITLFSRVINKPFWIWNIEEHKVADIAADGDCCFNHIIGLPKKGQRNPMFDSMKSYYLMYSNNTIISGSRKLLA